MNLLLDTHTFIWMMTDEMRLSPLARNALADVSNARWVSAVTAWESAIKVSINKLRPAKAGAKLAAAEASLV